MPYSPYDAYLESRVFSASPLELVGILYEEVISAVSAARQHLASGEIAERSRAITKAVDILTELTKSLDHATGGELSARLASLYDYAQRILLEANFRQDDSKLEEALSLLLTLQGAWSSIANADAVHVPEMGQAALAMSMAESGERSEPRRWSL